MCKNSKKITLSASSILSFMLFYSSSQRHDALAHSLLHSIICPIELTQKHFELADIND